MDQRSEQARILLESLPYIRRFYGKSIVIKIGGNVMTDPALKRDLALDVILMRYVGISPVVVHGGGPQVGDLMKRLGKKPEFVEGLRVTDAETMDLVEMVLVGKINKELVSLINHLGGKAVGLSGKDGGLITASKLYAQVPKEGDAVAVDLGQVGRVDEIHPEILTTVQGSGFIPVIAPTGTGKEGESFNINADTVAGELAAAISAEKLIFLTDVEGIRSKEGELLSTLHRSEIDLLVLGKTISGGMLPKVEACLKALDAGVPKTHIIDGRVHHAVILEIFTDRGIGTEIVP